MVLADWFQPSGWTIALDSDDSAVLESAMSRPCLAVNSASSTRRFMYPTTGAVDGERAKGISEGSIEAWIRKGSATNANIGFFCYGIDIPSSGVSGFSGYIATINYGTGVTDQFQIIKYTDGTASTLASFNFSPNFSTSNNAKWQKMKLTWWNYQSTSIALKLEFDDNAGAGLVSVNPDSPIAAVDTEPLTAVNQMTVGIYQTGADSSKKIDDFKLSASASIAEDAAPTITIDTFENHSNDPDIPAGGIHMQGSAIDDLAFAGDGDYCDSAVEIKIDAGAWVALDDAAVDIGALTAASAQSDDDITISWQAVYTGISVGSHTAHARITDAGGTLSSEVSSSFTVT